MRQELTGLLWSRAFKSTREIDISFNEELARQIAAFADDETAHDARMALRRLLNGDTR